MVMLPRSLLNKALIWGLMKQAILGVCLDLLQHQCLASLVHFDSTRAEALVTAEKQT